MLRRLPLTQLRTATRAWHLAAAPSKAGEESKGKRTKECNSVHGLTGENVRIEKEVDEDALRKELQARCPRPL